MLVFCGCSLADSFIDKLSFFDEADIDSLKDKAFKAWDEVGKDAIKDAAGDAADVLFGDGGEILWPNTPSTENIPEVHTGIINNVKEKNSITEIQVKEITLQGYEDYIHSLEEHLGPSVSQGIYRIDNRLISAIYDENKSTLTITISTIKQNTSNVTSEENVSSENEQNNSSD